ncbi:universal stress protein [Parapedobacter koreensis]|uniref:Nucleotide-binding universal stress protein, UspA family n=1 Tax=Parapedobacter koreensis TaxID=332977 RepID=A0A1H7MFG8_9SPHI|nr:universal stress protein [Parapedobacter koreensis]SEL09983.1 Nucleotide-binding universal stress protein, UspA family [Parapedobacter koreensis]
MEKIILVPTDFSSNALKATKYALKLGENMDCKVHLLHAYMAFHSAFQSELANRTDEQRAELGAQKGMNGFLETLGLNNGSTGISTSIEKADLADAVKRFIAGNDTALIVMGTHGASGLKMGLLGSNTYDVAKVASVPMLIMPLNAADVKPEKVIFFTDYREADQYTLSSLVDLFGHLVRQCSLVHIHEESAPPTAEDEQKLTTWKERLQGVVPHARLDSELVYGKESVALVDDILDNYDASLTVLTLVGGRSFFEKLIHKSLAKAIVHQPKTPVLLLADESL